MTDKMIYKLPHGYYGGGVFKEYSPSVTVSSWEFNNLLVEYDGMENDSWQQAEESAPGQR